MGRRTVDFVCYSMDDRDDTVIKFVTVHKIHGSVQYDTVVSWFGTFSIQQKLRNAREMSLIKIIIKIIK